MDDAPSLSRQERLAAVMTAAAARPVVPAVGALETSHIGKDDLPWIVVGEGAELQLLHVDLNIGLWISKTRLRPGSKVQTHYHTGLVYAVTLQGSWYYLESPEAVNTAGSYLFEPAGSRHTLVTPATDTEDMITWFAIYGANINVNEAGQVTAIIDAKAALDIYRGYCNALDLDCSKLIVIGEPK
jgi:hypothetical protein